MYTPYFNIIMYFFNYAMYVYMLFFLFTDFFFLRLSMCTNWGLLCWGWVRLYMVGGVV